ncbi:MAG: hypothetical protein J6K39_04235 [Clostridia bacterium]|nr:hypothetical protein [Clostridia bacterium]
MITDYYVRSLVEKNMAKAQQLFISGREAERVHQFTAAKSNYELSLGRYKDCYELSESYNDTGCMMDAKQGIDRVQKALDKMNGLTKN